MLGGTYVLPIRRSEPERSEDLSGYLRWLAQHLEVLVVDNSPAHVFDAHHEKWAKHVEHVPPDPDQRTLNGKVGNVVTGVRRASHERVIVADDDVRYERDALERMLRLLDAFDVVRPQNYFDPLPWHARWDTARSLLNRLTGGDWPGTLGVRRSALLATGGYDGSVLFENLELVRTVVAAGGREAVPLDLFVRRLPPTTEHFWSQRVRQAYDEFARPHRLLVPLAALPMALGLAARGRWGTLAASAAVIVGAAEAGRRRGGGARVFPASASLMAPAWVMERAVTSWLAVGSRVVRGGVPYGGRVVARAATPMRVLRTRHAPDRQRGGR